MVPAGSVTAALEDALLEDEEVVAAGTATVPLAVTGVAGRDVGIVTDVASVASEEVETATTFGVVTAAEVDKDLDLQADFLVLDEVPFTYGAPDV